jgi:hypothetical protein
MHRIPVCSSLCVLEPRDRWPSLLGTVRGFTFGSKVATGAVLMRKNRVSSWPLQLAAAAQKPVDSYALGFEFVFGFSGNCIEALLSSSHAVCLVLQNVLAVLTHHT